jgi:hypothetical protein
MTARDASLVESGPTMTLRHDAPETEPEPDRTDALDLMGAFRNVPRTGVIYVMTEAQKRGFHLGAEGWCNLGQGQPESGPAAGRAPRVESVPSGRRRLRSTPPCRASGSCARRWPTSTIELYPQGPALAVLGGERGHLRRGRSALTRAAAALGTINLGHFLPDYTAYEELLDVFRRLQPIPILLDPDRATSSAPSELRREILGRGLSAILLSNPCNPTGKLVHGDELPTGWTSARSLDCSLLIDEFYSHYIWRVGDTPPMVSAAEYVEDVDRDPVVLFDGLTKNWRYPGWRITLDAGPPDGHRRHGQRGLLPRRRRRGARSSAPPSSSCTPEHTLAETAAIASHLRPQARPADQRLRAGGSASIDGRARGHLLRLGRRWPTCPSPSPAATGFFRAALEHQVICVPGDFFDINPGKRRMSRPSRFRHHVRFSFGPDMEVIESALARLGEMIRSHR